MLSPEFVKSTRCLHTGSPLRLAEPSLVARLNRAIVKGDLRNKLGELITRSLDAALINEVGDLVYPVIDDIPVLLRDEAIDVGQLSN